MDAGIPAVHDAILSVLDGGIGELIGGQSKEGEWIIGGRLDVDAMLVICRIGGGVDFFSFSLLAGFPPANTHTNLFYEPAHTQSNV